MTTFALFLVLAFGPVDPPGPVWTVDRVIDSTWVVLESPDGAYFVDVHIDHLPGAREGARFTLTPVEVTP